MSSLSCSRARPTARQGCSRPSAPAGAAHSRGGGGGGPPPPPPPPPPHPAPPPPPPPHPGGTGPDTRITIRGDRWGWTALTVSVLPQLPRLFEPVERGRPQPGISRLAATPPVCLSSARRERDQKGGDQAQAAQKRTSVPFFEKQGACTVARGSVYFSAHRWSPDPVRSWIQGETDLRPRQSRPFVKIGKKNDPADAAALCEAALRLQPDVRAGQKH